MRILKSAYTDLSLADYMNYKGCLYKICAMLINDFSVSEWRKISHTSVLAYTSWTSCRWCWTNLSMRNRFYKAAFIPANMMHPSNFGCCILFLFQLGLTWKYWSLTRPNPFYPTLVLYFVLINSILTFPYLLHSCDLSCTSLEPAFPWPGRSTAIAYPAVMVMMVFPESHQSWKKSLEVQLFS